MEISGVLPRVPRTVVGPFVLVGSGSSGSSGSMELGEMNKVRLPTFANPANLVEPKEEQIELAPGETSIGFLQKVYRSKHQPMNVRMRAAIEAAPYEHPKLTAVGLGSLEGTDFAAKLERAIVRSMKVIEGRVMTEGEQIKLIEKEG